jgi:hypothetical protein
MKEKTLRFDIILLLILAALAIWTEVDKYLRAKDAKSRSLNFLARKSTRPAGKLDRPVTQLGGSPLLGRRFSGLAVDAKTMRTQ